MLSWESRSSVGSTKDSGDWEYDSRSLIAALTSPWDFIAICFRKCGSLFKPSEFEIFSKRAIIVPRSSFLISTNLDFCLTGESFDCQTSLQVMMIGKLDIAITRTSSGMPPMSVPVTPSTSSIRIILLFLKRDCCLAAG